MKTVIQSLISHVDNDNTRDIEINFLADKKLEAEWTEIKKCEPGKVHVRTSGMPGSPRVPKMRTHFTAMMPLTPVNKGPKGIEYQIQYEKLAEKYPNWSNANKYKTRT